MAAVTWAGRKRTPNEVAGLRARAEYLLADANAHPERTYAEYMRRHCTAVLDTLDWIAGERAESPATGDVVEPDESGLRRERMRGEDLENARIREGGDAVTPGTAAQTLCWYMHDPYAEAPVL